ncbi:MAG: adenylate/guanylate cyclase domain-containing protein [Epsilonproteobacteria bacterium]|nr:MAG: adenylate/guanylate cyclase domain-containing protein [Campylobacterota bacterium]
MSRLLIKSSAALILALLLSWAYLFMPQTFFSLNNNLRDFLFTIRGELPKSDKIVIVDIDEAALKQFGQWPWPRSVVAELINKLSDADAGIIGLDIVFAEPDRTSPHRIVSKIKGNTAKLENYDFILSETLARTPTIGGYFFTFEENDENNTPLIPATIVEKGLIHNNSILEPKGIVLNLDILQEKFYSSGFFNNIPDKGGMIHRVPLVMRYDGMVYPSLVLEMARVYSASSKVEIYGDEIGVRKIKFGAFNIPTDHAGRLIVNFRGAGKHFKYISAADIINENFNISEIADKFVLIGTSSVGLSDIRSIPFDSTIPGVEVHANTLDNILKGDFLDEPADVIVYDLLIIWSIIFLFLFLFSYLSSWLLLPIVIGMAFVLFQIFYYILFDLGIVLNLLFPMIAFWGVLILSISIDYVITLRQREYLQHIFSKKVSKAVMNDLIKYGRENILEVRDQNVAIFFSDIRGFTSIGETIGSSKKLVALLNRYMTPMVDEISNREGTIDKFIGDAIMAYWNAPNRVDNYVDKAVISALEQIKILEQLNNDLNEEFGITLQIGIGIHTGSVTVGEMGSPGRSDYTIIGDNVNLAARIEGLNKLYGTTIIISEDTKKQLKEDYIFRPLDIVRVKGKNEAVEIYEVLPAKDKNRHDELEYYGTALETYRQGKTKEAYRLFQSLEEEYSCELYHLYLQRCQDYLDHPERLFDLIYTM